MTKTRAPSTTPFVVSSPLWSRAPARDADGKAYFDFMMLIPGLKKESEAGQQSCTVKIKNSLKEFENVVVYVDLNIKLNLLWVSIKPVPEVSRLIMQAIQREIPHARVVAADFNPETPENPRSQGWLVKMGQKVSATLRITRS
jgi:hypothetical protein